MELVAVIALLQILLLPLHLEEKHELEHCHIQQQHLEWVLLTHVEAFEVTHSNHPFGMTLAASPSRRDQFGKFLLSRVRFAL